MFCKKVAPEACNFIKRETLAQMFSCEFCKISKNTIFQRTPPMGASKYYHNSGSQSWLHIETSQLICRANQLTGFYIMITLRHWMYLWDPFAKYCEVFFFSLDFLSRAFTNYRAAGEGGGHFFDSSLSSTLPLPPAYQALRH